MESGGRVLSRSEQGCSTNVVGLGVVVAVVVVVILLVVIQRKVIVGDI
jgi:hypothetical protein